MLRTYSCPIQPGVGPLRLVTPYLSSCPWYFSSTSASVFIPFHSQAHTSHHSIPQVSFFSLITSPHHFLFMLPNWQIAHHASAHGGLSTNGLSDNYLLKFFWNDSIELLEIMFDGRAFHSLAVVWRTNLFPNVLDECLIWRNWLLCLREQRVLCLIYWSSGMFMMLCSIFISSGDYFVFSPRLKGFPS